MKLDWQHVVLAAIGIGCATACVLLGHGSLVLQLMAGLGGAAGVGSLLKRSPIEGGPKDEAKP